MTSLSFTATLKCMIQRVKDEQAGNTTTITKSAAEDNLSKKITSTDEKGSATHQYDITIGVKHNSFISAKDTEEIITIDSDESDSEVKSSTGHNTGTSFYDDNGANKYISSTVPFPVHDKCSLFGTVSESNTNSNKNFSLGNTSAFESMEKDESKQNIFPKVRIRENTAVYRSSEINIKGRKKLKHNIQSSIKKTPATERFCSYCSKSFATQHGLVKHNKFHCLLQNTFNILCKICGSKYADPSTLNNHIRKVHGITDTRKMSYYVGNSTLIPGENSVSKAVPKVAISVTKRIQQQKLIKQVCVSKIYCAYCSKHFTTKHGLEKHNKFHCLFQNTCNILCKICGSKYADPITLHNHIRKAHRIKDKHQMSYYVANSTLIPGGYSVSKAIPKMAASSLVAKRTQKSKSRKEFTSAALTGPNDVVYVNSEKKVARAGRKRSKNSKINFHCCKFCKKLFHSTSSLKYHLDYSCRFHKRYELMCKICDGKFAGTKSIRHHILRKHGIRIATTRKLWAHIVKLKACNTMKKANINLGKKRNAHEHKTDIECKISESAIVFDDMSMPSTFMNNRSYDKQFKCKTCLKSFGKQKSLNVHIRLCHNNLKKVKNISRKRERKIYFCTDCDKVLSSSSSLTMHLDFHCPTRKRYEYLCKICNNRYAGSRNMRRHLLNIHGIKVVTTGRSNNYMKKVKIAHSVNKSSNNNSNEKRISEENNCKEYSRIEPVMVHEDTKSNESSTSCNTLSQGIQFKCNHCFKSFTEECALDAHSHFCQGAFVDAESVNENQEGPVFCNVCDKKYFSLAKLVQHLQDHLLSAE